MAASYPDLRLHIESRNMAALMSAADLAIGTAGASAWERCCLGLPSVMLVVAENQRLIANNLRELGAAMAVTEWPDTIPAIVRLIKDASARERMIAAAAAATDGCGVKAVVEAMLGSAPSTCELTIRPATQEDSEQLWLWRNDPLMRAMAKSHDPVPWSAHQAWFSQCLANPDCLLLIAHAAGERVGMVRFDREMAAVRTVSINIAPGWRGRGVGRQLLAKACRAFEEQCGRALLQAEIAVGNPSSERIFTANGFVARGEATKPGYRRYERSVPAEGEFGLAPNPRFTS
jgi:L-amino acid N-acyltransferase YncA